MNGKFIRIPVMLILLLSCLGSAASPIENTAASQEMVFYPVADAYVIASLPGNNFGSLPALLVDVSPLAKSYLRFRVTGLTGLRITSARLQLFPRNSSNKGLSVRPVTSLLWGEKTITYTNAPTGKPTVLASVASVSAGTWINLPVTSYVTGEGFYGFVLTSPGDATINLVARENGSRIPRLVITVENTVPSPVLVGAGDIANCAGGGDEATAALIDAIPGTVFTAGDNAYPSGREVDFTNCYAPSWGRFKQRTYPAPGNHDYATTAAAAYYAYFGSSAGDPAKGYYSYNLGAWHIVVLNSEIDASTGSAQEKWLRQDLASNPRVCTLAYWHRPVFSSSSIHGNDPRFKTLWQALYDYRAEVVINGHDHTYERFAPQTPGGIASPRGIREFVAGMGGYSHYPFGAIQPNSQVRNSDTYGVLKFTLHAASYDWLFVPEAGKTFTDSGSSNCIP